MSYDIHFNRISRKRWTPLLAAILTITLLAVALLVVLRKSTAPTQRPLLVSRLQFQDLDSLIAKPDQSEKTLTWDRGYAGPHPPNSVEHDKNNGTSPYTEEFTVIMLTNQNRILDIPKTLEHLNGLEGLNRVILIWNAEKPASSSVIETTSELNFPVQVLTNGRNSLNNRFLPFEIIDTDAILSMDDDMFPSQDSIIFAFRVWQQFRDRIVGFPGRGVSWTEDGRWKYDPHPCSISMVLTGLAFFHKKYLNLYTHEMPPAIREMVENVTNCEDIAMNFLVSHLTQKPPIKVTPTNAWVCPRCDSSENGKVALWKDPKHFDERDNCINFFAQIYGYTPLFKSEYRLDDHFERNKNASSCARIPIPPTSTSHVISVPLVCLIVMSSTILLYYFFAFRHRRNLLR